MKPSHTAAGEPTGRLMDEYGRTLFIPDALLPADEQPLEKKESLEIVELRRRHDGWTADRQRLFLNCLANTGSIGFAANAAGITPRSAYRLRNHPKGVAFARAWDAALMRAGGRLLTVAFERATSGTPREVWRDGRCVARHSVPSDRMLMFLLRHLNPALFDAGGDMVARAATVDALQQGFAPAMRGLVDTEVDADLLDADDFCPAPPGWDNA